jgi:hypothetical protein
MGTLYFSIYILYKYKLFQNFKVSGGAQIQNKRQQALFPLGILQTNEPKSLVVKYVWFEYIS